MTRQEQADASVALMNWLESQGLDIESAVPILALTISAMIEGCAVKNGADAAEGALIVGNMIKETVGQLR